MRQDFMIIDNNLAEMQAFLMSSASTPLIVKLLDELREIMVSKGHDYSGNDHTFRNFERSAEIAHSSVDNAFFFLIGTKIARLCALTQDSLIPNNESIVDTWRDLINYQILYISYKEFCKQRGEPK